MTMADARVVKLAELLVRYCTDVRPGDWVLVRGDVSAMPLIEETLRQVVRAGGNPTLQLESDTLSEILLREAQADRLDWVAPSDALMAEQLDVRIGINAASNTRSLTGVDPKRQQTYQSARRKFQRRYMERSAEGSHRWVITNYPCPAFAQEADMSLAAYEEFVYAATFADQPDPVACWQEIRTTQQRLVDWLQGKDQVVVRGPNIDLTLSIAGRTFINSDGKRNMPSGEIFTGPVEESVNGWIRFTYPALRGGREVDGVEFHFEAGKVVRATAAKNEEYLLSQLESDAGARYLGEFAIGTNYQIQRFTKSILYDEKIGGTLHVARGRRLSGNRQPQPIRGALGLYLRHAPGERNPGRWRTLLSQWAVCRIAFCLLHQAYRHRTPERSLKEKCMQVREIMSSPAITVRSGAEIRDVARLMREHVISGVPVVDASGKLLGLITELDMIARNAPLHQPRYIAVLSAMIPVSLEEVRNYQEQLRQVLATSAMDLMRDEFKTVTPDTPVEDALEIMLDPEVTMLPVIEEGNLVGVVTRTDLVRLIEELEAAPDEGEAA